MWVIFSQTAFQECCRARKDSTDVNGAHEAYRAGNIDTALLKYALLAELGYEVAQSNVAYILDHGKFFVL